MQIVAPDAGIYFQKIPLMCVTDPELAPVTKHILSLLAHSYTWLGGTNAVLGGDAGMATNAKKLHKTA
jgi:hypothetical protein